MADPASHGTCSEEDGRTCLGTFHPAVVGHSGRVAKGWGCRWKGKEFCELGAAQLRNLGEREVVQLRNLGGRGPSSSSYHPLTRMSSRLHQLEMKQSQQREEAEHQDKKQ
ncbi:GPI-anchored protein 58 [Pyrus ussuriensis x Pyrus communis]|uniref:GPI-anchored protein 58 n=1 Tax=Pyrus ussuriensis x Pyrus communis TaxID=2448454 RepID=A0A5N5FXT4_9ROSA|nr:GPI-anchored protein 58 [Pyrus ussuriensis x Pyrus communis]